MSKRKLLVLTPIPPDLRSALALRYDLTDFDASKAEIWRGFEIAITTGMNGAGIREFDACPDLKLVVSQGVGLDKIDLDAARRRGIAVAHTPDEIAEDVGDAAVAMIYAAMRGVVQADAFVRAGRWGRERIAPSRRIAGKTVGIIGLGRIGQHVAQRAQAIGMSVLYHGRAAKPGVTYPFVATLDELAARADVLVLSCPGGKATHHLINKPILEKLGPDGFLVNMSRGSVVDEAALLDALEAKSIAGAALDVFENEPNIDPRFFTLDNVVLAPHSSSITHETRAAIIARMLGDIEAFLNSAPFFNAAEPPESVGHSSRHRSYN